MGKHHLGQTHRIRLWQACVCTSALYSQHIVGLTTGTLRRLTIALTKQLRAVLRQRAHLTHITAAAIWDMAHIAMPGWTIQQTLQRHQQKLHNITTATAVVEYVQALAVNLDALLTAVATEVSSGPII